MRELVFSSAQEIDSNVPPLPGASISPQMLLDFDVQSSEGQFVLTWFSIAITCLVYTVLTVFGLRNFFKYIIKQQYQLQLLYVFAVLAAATRLGRYGAMAYHLCRGFEPNEIRTQLSLTVDLICSCLMIAAGLCLSLIMFKLYTYLQCWSIYLHQQRQTYNNAERLRETRKQQHSASKRFQCLKYVLHAAMALVTVFTTTQLVLVYTNSAYAGVNPTTVTAEDFVASQEASGLPWLSFLSLQQVYIDQGIFYLLNAFLLYTAIFFLVSVMNDLGQQNAIMYVEGSSSMENEKKRLKIILTLFGTSYVFRGAFDLAIGIYLYEFQDLASEYPGFFELGQSLYYIVTDLIPIMAFFHMHHQVYGGAEDQEQRQPEVQMQVNPDAARAYHLQNNNAQYLQTVLVNIIEATESSQRNSSVAGSQENVEDSFHIHENYSTRSNCQLYQEGFGGGYRAPSREESSLHNLDPKQKKFASHTDSFKSVRHCGLLTKNAIRQIQSDIVTVEALSRLQSSDLNSQQFEQTVHDQQSSDPVEIVEEIKETTQMEELYTEVLIEDAPFVQVNNVKTSRLSDEIRAYNKHKNHFSKSTAEESEFGVRDLECLLDPQEGVYRVTKEHNNRSSSAFGSVRFSAERPAQP